MRARNWGKAIGQAGKHILSVAEIERLQKVVFGTKALKSMGIRREEGFIGEHDRDSFIPIPDHISAKAIDLPILMRGLIDANNLLQKSSCDAVLIATVIAFGFVFIHPLSDGNGRIHRYLIHHVLSKKNYVKQDVIFPISASILNRISDYQGVLEAYASPRLDLIKWQASTKYNVEILNDTIDLYRYYDLTEQAEFLYECIDDTIENIIPKELDYLRKYDQLTNYINQLHIDGQNANKSKKSTIFEVQQNKEKYAKFTLGRNYKRISKLAKKLDKKHPLIMPLYNKKRNNMFV